MNEQKNKSVTEVTITDLKKLGLQGGATAYLSDGQEVILHKNYGLIRRKGFVAGELQTVEVVESYVSLYAKIRTIKRNDIIVARRVRKGSGSKLLLTGRGYHRQTN